MPHTSSVIRTLSWCPSRIGPKPNFHKIVDFSPANVQGQGTSGRRSNPPGFLTFHHVQSFRSNPEERNIFVIVGKDHGENCWVTATLHQPTWDVLEESLQKNGEWPDSICIHLQVISRSLVLFRCRRIALDRLFQGSITLLRSQLQLVFLDDRRRDFGRYSCDNRAELFT